jgi:sugar lactone lactonase YvrE
MTVVALQGAELAIDIRCLLGESPVWHAEAEELLWVDIRNALLYRWSSRSGNTTTIHVGHAVSAVAPRASGGYIVATRLGYGTVDEGGAFEVLSPVESDLAEHRMNDGKCDRQGRFWAGTMSERHEPGAGSLYRLDRGGSVARVLEGVTISNGLDWSPDDTTMYYVDSLAGSLDAFDFDAQSGEVTRRRRLVEIDRSLGLADGIAVDVDGCIWVALHSGGAVHRYSPSGALLARLELPVAIVTSCAFGGSDLRDLYITTAVRPDAAEKLAGAVFRYSTGVQGFPGRSYEG